MHLKRNNIGKFWPIPRKGTKYLAVPSHNQNEAMPLVVVLRNVLKVVKNKKELKRLLNEKKIQVNHKEIKETNYPICLFDIISFPESKNNYKVVLSKDKKMIFEEISGKKSETKVYKLMNKKMLTNKITQFNLMQGKNIISKEKANVGDSILFNLKDNKIEKIIPLEKGREAFVMNGKHASHVGKIEELVERGGKLIAKIKSDDGKINVWTKNIIVIE